MAAERDEPAWAGYRRRWLQRSRGVMAAESLPTMSEATRTAWSFNGAAA